MPFHINNLPLGCTLLASSELYNPYAFDSRWGTEYSFLPCWLSIVHSSLVHHLYKYKLYEDFKSFQHIMKFYMSTLYLKYITSFIFTHIYMWHILFISVSLIITFHSLFKFRNSSDYLITYNRIILCLGVGRSWRGYCYLTHSLVV